MRHLARLRSATLCGLLASGALALGSPAYEAVVAWVTGPAGDAAPAPFGRAPPSDAPLVVRHAPFQPQALIDKPLFLPARAKPQAPPPALPVEVAALPPIVEEPPPAYVVQGIVATLTARKALLRTGDRPRSSWIAEGAVSAEGWTLLSIGLNCVTLRKGARLLTLDLKPTRARKSLIAIK